MAGTVVFSRDKDENVSEIWDDTALIKAYDEAVSSMKAQMGSQIGEDFEKGKTGTASSDKKKNKKSRRKHRKKDKGSKPTVQQLKQWKVGDLCRAVYTEDGQIYEAIILSFDQEDESCTVRYLGYGNEEDHSIADLLPSKEGLSAAGSRTVSECDSMDWSQHGTSPKFIPPSRFSPFSMGGMGRGWSHAPPPLLPHIPGTLMSDMAMPPMMPPMFPPTMCSGMPSFNSSAGHIPSPMGLGDLPPPPTIDEENTVHNDQEALYSMLMAWYMTGYHTGYYQGLKQGKKTKITKEKVSQHTAQDGTDSAR